jgi:protocatechuate 3,4-dioxygenase beta subunit
MDHEPHDHDRGLLHDLPTLLGRRRAVTLFAGAGLVGGLTACGLGSSGGGDDASASTTSTTSDDASASTTSTTAASTASATSAIPEETAGPYPGDGSNGVNVLTESGIVRSDIRSSFGDASATAEGVPLTVTLTVIDLANGFVPLPGAAVYLWHCDRDGQYSLYSNGITEENYLRGVQAADSAGVVTFTSIFPGAYSGRWPHIHFEVYPNVDEATKAGSKLVTSQLAFPEDACNTAYATEGYEQSVRNMAQSSLDSDMVFSDGYSQQLATVTGDVASGFVATLSVPV